MICESFKYTEGPLTTGNRYWSVQKIRNATQMLGNIASKFFETISLSRAKGLRFFEKLALYMCLT